MYGFIDKDLEYMIKVFSEHSDIEKVILFGSRAMGNYKKSSDVDIAIFSDSFSRRDLLRLSDELNEEYPLPYFFDIVDYKSISNQNLKKHIDEYGKRLYVR